MNTQIFREYDIRGIVGKDLTEDVVVAIGKSYGSYMRKKGLKKIAVGRDGRLSSNTISEQLCKGILSTGCDVVDVGMLPTPVLYFSLHHIEGMEGGIMITGSHNPSDYNGFKLCLGHASIYGEEIQKIRKIIEKGEFEEGTGVFTEYKIISPYIEMIKEKINLKKGLSVVIDAGNGMGAMFVPSLMREVGVEVKSELYCEVDGRFPNHHPDPTVTENLADIRAKVKETGADVGLAYDGDADRIGVVDDKGEIIWGDKLMILLSREILSRKPGAKIIFEVKCSQNLHDDIKKHGGEPIMWKTGHSLIKEKMKSEKAELAGEMSGHIFFADQYFGYDDAIYASMRLLEILSNTGRKLSDLLADVPEVCYTPEIRVDCPDEKKFEVVEKLKGFFKENYDVIDIDGIRILFKEGWGLIRASNTQPVLVLRFEAASEEALKEMQDIVRKKLNETGADVVF